MPSLFELLSDPVSLTVLGLYAAVIVLEALMPARALPAVRGWKLRGTIAFVVYFLISSYLPLFLGAQLAHLQLFDLSALGKWGGAAVAVLAYEAGAYFWHRAMHASNFLWRTFHQMHHSAERLDTFGAFWFSPMDMVGWTLLFSVCMTVLGVAPQAVVLAVYATTFLSVFQHANIRTPRWLGTIVQRPESHSRHHARGMHTGNYSDLPVFDMLMGTFHNPAGFFETGFYQGASSRVPEMLVFRDVSAAPATPAEVRVEDMPRAAA
jgi:sterol desaturase/sphingolipid hydroxylase (fatty acid hydroxylase superfamily)